MVVVVVVMSAMLVNAGSAAGCPKSCRFKWCSGGASGGAVGGCR